MTMKRSENDSRIDYVEMNVRDLARTKAFYGGASGWKLTDYGEDYCAFSDGRHDGGFATAEPPNPGGWFNLLRVPGSARASAARRPASSGSSEVNLDACVTCSASFADLTSERATSVAR